MTQGLREFGTRFLSSLKTSFVISLFGTFVTPEARQNFWATVPSFSIGWALWITIASLYVFPKFKKLPLWVAVLGIGATMLGTIVLAFSTSLYLFLLIGYRKLPWDPSNLQITGSVIAAPQFRLTLIIAFVLMLCVTFIFKISQMLGPGVLIKWIRGHYRDPKIENRIFMFLDMKDSTTLAEQLSPVAFSTLVQRFLGDISEPILQTRGEVSHYIGDEAVLTWQTRRPDAADQCLKFFELFSQKIESQRMAYEAEFGLCPEFKAGAHLGQVVATQVGEIKTEIVYHGDVLNTAARIQGLCNEFRENFLISAELAQSLSSQSPYSIIGLGKVDLKGKEEPMDIVAVRTATGAGSN